MAGRPKRQAALKKAEQRRRAQALRDRYLREAADEVRRKAGTERYIRRIENLNG